MTTPAARQRIEKAERFLKSARILLAADDPESAVSRAYYAAYHAVIAVLEVKAGQNRRRWDHTELYRAFVETFSRRGFLFDRRDGAALAEIRESRLQADYATSGVPLKQANRSVQRADALITKIRKVLHES